MKFTDVATLACAAALLGSLCTSAVAALFEDLPLEPTYESACKNWTPITGQCVVMSAKDSRAKFISTMGGGIHTVYVSEVLGHCPTLPNAAQLLPFLDQGIQVIVGTGEKPDFRIAPNPNVRQKLVDGYLPMVTTTWEDDNGLSYEQTSFVRLIGDRMDVRKGDENAAAYMRVRVSNKSMSDQQAHLWLSICYSGNTQGRAIPTYEYRSPLHFGGDRVTTDSGQLRVLWQAPKDAKTEPAIRDKVLVPEEHGDYVGKSPKGYELDKAFDKIFPSAWAPTTDKLAGTTGLGLRFPETRWVKGVSIFSLGGFLPAADGQDVQYFDGHDWKSLDFTMNGKTSDELKEHPELAQTVGEIRAYGFEPVQAQAVRLMITKTAPEKPYPALNSFDVTYSLDYDPTTGQGKWIDTGAGDPASNNVHFTAAVPAGEHRDLVVIVPFLPASGKETAWLSKRSFEQDLAASKKHWQAITSERRRFRLPETVVQEVLDANIPHIFTGAEIDATNGLPIILTNIGWYEAVWGNLAAAEIIGLDMLGYHKDAERYLDTFIEWQGKSTPPGNFKSREGFLSSADEYTWVRWTSNHGWLLWALGEHYLLSGDREWLNRKLPNILAACDWVERERSRTKVDKPDGTRPPEWGLLPPGVTGDGAPPCYQFATDAFTWAGLNSAAEALRQIKHPRAAEVTSAVEEYKKCIITAAQWAADNSQPYKLASGREIPFISNDLYNTWNITNENKHPWWLDVGPLHLVDCGVVDARSKLAGWMIDAGEDYWLKFGLALYEPWYAPQRAVYYGRDQINKFLDVYYNELAEGMDRQTYCPVEGHGGCQNLSWADGEHIKFVRMMLIRENGNTLDLCTATPRAWLEQGKSISVTDAPTHFGSVSFTLTSDVDNNRITAGVTPPTRISVPVRLRIRHPQARPIKSVKVNGIPSKPAGEWISIPAGQGRREIEVTY